MAKISASKVEATEKEILCPRGLNDPGYRVQNVCKDEVVYMSQKMNCRHIALDSSNNAI